VESASVTERVSDRPAFTMGDVHANAGYAGPAFQFGGESFVRASAFVQAISRAGQDAGSLTARPSIRGGWALARTLISLPRIEVVLTDEPSGVVLRQYLCVRTHGLRSHLLARGVLAIPPDPGSYLAGRSRRALRTNMARAQALGVSCQDLVDADKAGIAIAQLMEVGLIGPLNTASTERWLLAVDRAGAAVGGALVTVDRHWAMLSMVVARSSPIRYALHAELVRCLSGLGVQYLFTRSRSALALPPGLQYLQSVLGYTVVNLKLSSRPA